MASLLRNRTFVVLFSAQAISLVGSGVTTIALALFVHRLAGASAATAVLGNALMLRIAAFLLFSQPAGVLADRVNRKVVLIASDLARLALLALFPFITTVWQVYAAVFAVNSLTAFFTPTFDASLPDVVGSEQYVKALSYSRIAVDLEAIAGPIIAGVLVAMIGLRWVFWFDGATYLVSALLVSSVAIPSPRNARVPLVPTTLLGDITYGARVLLRQAAIRQALLMSLAEALAGACAIVITVAYVRDILHGTETAYSLAMAAIGIGSGACALVLGRYGSRLERSATGEAAQHGLRHRWASKSILLGGILLALSLAPAALTPPLPFLAVLWVLNGAGQALIAIPSSTLVASHTLADERGRAFAAQFAITHACWLFTYPLAGHLAESVGPSNAFLLCGLACLGITGIAAAIGKPDAAHVHPGMG